MASELTDGELRLWAVGVNESAPDKWSMRDEVALVVAHDANEARVLAGHPLDRCILVEFDRPKLLVRRRVIPDVR